VPTDVGLVVAVTILAICAGPPSWRPCCHSSCAGSRSTLRSCAPSITTLVDGTTGLIIYFEIAKILLRL